MSVEDINVAAVRRLHEAVTKRDFSSLSELFTPDYTMTMNPNLKGPEGVKKMFTDLTAAFPDYSETIENIVAKGDLVAVFYTLRGTFKNAYAGTAPTGKKFEISNAVLARFKGGKQVHAAQYADSLAWYQQLGIPIPTK
jgi:predicted ester cyclase